MEKQKPKKRDIPSWHAKTWVVPELSDLEFLHATNVTYHYPKHIHEAYSIVLIIRGVELTTYRNSTTTSFPGNLLLFNVDEEHSSESLETEYRIMKVASKVLNQMALEVLGHPLTRSSFSRLVIRDPQLFKRFYSLHHLVEQSRSALEMESELVSALGHLLSHCDENRLPPSANQKEARHVNLIRDYLKGRFAENVSLAELAQVTNLSSFYLLRAFQRQVGLTPHQFQTQVRVARARKLIRQGCPIAQVALETGFFDQSHFCKTFKQIVGIPPGQYSQQRKFIQDGAS